MVCLDMELQVSDKHRHGLVSTNVHDDNTQLNNTEDNSTLSLSVVCELRQIQDEAATRRRHHACR